MLKISCNNQTIERVHQYKLLGVVIDEHFELYTHQFAVTHTNTSISNI